MNWMIGLIDRIFAVAGALLFAQAPHFLEHYKQRLAGHVSELQQQIQWIEQSAQKIGKTLPEYIQYFFTQTDPIMVNQGHFMDSLVTRYSDLSSSYQSLVHATPMTRPFVFMRHINLSIAQNTVKDFSFGFSLTIESVCYAFIGLCVGYFIFSLIKFVIKTSLKNLRSCRLSFT